jgi:predicted transcriptional regulator
VKGAIKAAPVKNTPPPKSETAENEKSEKPKAKEVEKTVTDDLIIVLDEEF